MDESKLTEGDASPPQFTHFTIIADGRFVQFSDAHKHAPGEVAFMGLKVWAESAERAVRIADDYSKRVGFRLAGTVEVHTTPHVRPCRGVAGVYDLQFTLYNPAAQSESPTTT